MKGPRLSADEPARVQGDDVTSAWFLAPQTYANIRECPSRHRDGSISIGCDFAGRLGYGYRHCADCSYARELTGEELAQFTVGGTPLRRP